jgi:hypothetical protein
MSLSLSAPTGDPGSAAPAAGMDVLTGTDPGAATLQPGTEGAVQAPPAERVPLIETPDGSKYFSQEAANQGLIEKARYIESLKQQVEMYQRQQVQPTVQPPPQASGPSERETFIQESAREYVDQLGLDPKAAEVLARRDWNVQEQALKRAQDSMQQRFVQQEGARYQQIVSTDPRFDMNNPANVHRYTAIGIARANPNMGADQHYQIFRQLVDSNGNGNSSQQQPQVPPYTGWNGLPQAGVNQQLFRTPGSGAGAPPGAPALSPFQQQAINAHKQMVPNATEQELAQIAATAAAMEGGR